LDPEWNSRSGFQSNVKSGTKKEKLARHAKCADKDERGGECDAKEKGRNRGLAADSPESYCTKMSSNLQGQFQKVYVTWTGETNYGSWVSVNCDPYGRE